MDSVDGDGFECRASQFVENLQLKDDYDDGADRFFDVMSTPPANEEPNEEFFTPMPEKITAPVTKFNNLKANELEPIAEACEEEEALNKSRSLGGASGLPTGRIILKARRSLTHNRKTGISTEAVIFDGIKLDEPPREKRHTMTTRGDAAANTPTLLLRNRKITRQSLKRSRISSSLTNEYRSIAEQVHRFFVDTPPRFKSRRTSTPVEHMEVQKLVATLPKTPQLRTKERSRCDHSHAEEVVSSEIKPLPINRKILENPDFKVKPNLRKSTVFQPFNLTHSKKYDPPKNLTLRPSTSTLSLASTASHESHFAPKCSSTAPTSPAKSTCSSISGVAPLSEVVAKDGKTYSGVPLKGQRKRVVEVRPFSFDVRDRIAQKNKEAKIKQIQEDLAKIPKFTANPVPEYLREAGNTTCSTVHSTHSKNALPQVENFTFKAKPALVLETKPFVPKKSDKPLTDITEFKLNTEKRAKVRAEFDQAVKAKLEEEELRAKEFASMLEECEKAEVARMRKKTEFKANPVPKFVSSASNTPAK